MWTWRKKYNELMKEYKTLKEMHENQSEYVEHLELRIEILKKIADRYFKDKVGYISEEIFNEITEGEKDQKFFDSDWLKQNGLLWDKEGM
jgi:hypothetical protein